MRRGSDILVCDDDNAYLNLMRIKLTRKGYKVRIAQNVEVLMREIESLPGLMLLDVSIPSRYEGLEILEKIKRDYPELPVFMISAHGETKTIVQAIKIGASDYFYKPDLNESEWFEFLVKRINEEFGKPAAKTVDAQLEGLYPGFEKILGGSELTRQLINLARLAAPEEINVLLLGDTGTGKELLARAIHDNSPRKSGPFVSVNCAAIPEQLAESEFFGHVKGAFTGALNQRIGKFEQADKGTIFLDEIGDMPLALQSKILRVLEDKMVTMVGGTSQIPVNCRVIAATNRNLEEEVENNNFRNDLFYRLNGFPIRLPSLDERKEDIPVLLEHFIRKYNHGKPQKTSKSLMKSLMEFSYKGNIRQLENMVQYALIVSKDTVLEIRHFPMVGGRTESGKVMSLAESERIAIENAMRHTQNKSEAAKLLGISRPTLHKKLKDLNIES